MYIARTGVRGRSGRALLRRACGGEEVAIEDGTALPCASLTLAMPGPPGWSATAWRSPLAVQRLPRGWPPGPRGRAGRAG
jgi:hypothetical protein